jgi:hypothetical protein
MLELYLVIKSFCFVLQLVGFTIRGQIEGNFGLGFHFETPLGIEPKHGLNTLKL